MVPEPDGDLRITVLTIQASLWNSGSAELPTSNDQCKNDGWKSYGTTFRNQGDCVSFVATKGKNQPAG